MNDKPRQLLAAAALACLLGPAADVRPQSRPKQAPRKPSAEEARRRRESREWVAALREAAELARGFEDLYESADAQAKAADLLWPHDEATARAVLCRAWESVTAPGVEGRIEGAGIYEDPEEDKRETLAAARRHVLTAAMKHDARLGEAFMQELLRLLESGAAGAEVKQRERLSGGGGERLSLAYRLLGEGDFKRAAEAFAPLVDSGARPGQLINFISSLRASAPREADALYLRLLARARTSPATDANDVLSLSAPVVSPGFTVFLDEHGTPSFGRVGGSVLDGRAGQPAVSQEVRRAFYEAAAAVLLRPAPTDGADAAGAQYFAIGRLLPFFEREAPQFSAQLHARSNALASSLAPARRDALAASMGVQDLAAKNPVDPLAAEVAAVKAAPDATERDFIRLRAVLTASRRSLWERARTLAGEFESADAQRDARLVLALHQVLGTFESFDDSKAEAVERAADFARAADVPPEARAAGLGQAAELLARLGARARADALFAEAAGYAAQAAREDGRRTTALALVSLSAARGGSPRLWELLPALARAADETEDLSYGALSFWFTVGPEKRRIQFAVPDSPFQLTDVFAAAAPLEAARTLAEARSLSDEVLRARALLAAARAGLGKASVKAAAPAR